jgi:signal transduction histidine kinase
VSRSRAAIVAVNDALCAGCEATPGVDPEWLESRADALVEAEGRTSLDATLAGARVDGAAVVPSAVISLPRDVVGTIVTLDEPGRVIEPATRRLLGDIAEHLAAVIRRQHPDEASGPARALADIATDARTLLDSIAEGVVIMERDVDRELRFTAVNLSAGRMLRRKRSELIGRPMRAEFPQSEQFFSAFVDCLESQRVGELEDYYAPLGRHFATRIFPHGDAVMVMFIDTTERHEALEALRRTTDALHRILDHVGGAVTVVDTAGEVLAMNRAASRFLGLGDDWPRATPKLTIADVWARFSVAGNENGHPGESWSARLLRGEAVVDLRLRASAPGGGPSVIDLSGAPLRGSDGSIRGAVLLMRDVSDEEALSHVRDELPLLAARELRNPLAVIKSYAEIIVAEPLGERAAHVLTRLRRGAERMDATIQSLDAVARLASGGYHIDPSPLRLDDLLRSVLRRGAYARVSVDRCDPVTVEVDREKIERVIEQLIDNALKFSTGAVDVSLRAVGREAVLAVRDAGIGIPATRQPRIFEPFYRAHGGTPHDRGGLGLGLHLSRAIVERHHGRMWFTSAEMAGSCFSFSLPIAEERSARR